MTKNNENHFNPPNKRPNFLFFMVDQERFRTVYESKELKRWRKENLKTQELLKKNGMEFLNHYAGSTACSPSRGTLFTGQYPSLHGVTQTPGIAKEAFDPNVFWLDPNTVPTLGDYFRAAGYDTYYKGKFHIAYEDILIPDTHNALPSYSPITGVPDRETEKNYLHADRLDPFGFSGWIGPEPHGTAPHNSGSSAAVGVSGRDVVYSAEVVHLIKELEEKATSDKHTPWFIVSSFVNPHDIALYGLITALNPLYDFKVDPSVPFIPPAPTADESLLTKPIAQRSYREIYQEAFQPTRDTLFYRRLYFSLQKQVDKEMMKVFQTLKNSTFYENTIVIFASDHGELLGAHGGLFQKWYNTYEESIHVPLIIHSPKLFSNPEKTDMLTSHVDVLPTLLGLADIDVKKIRKQLQEDHTEVHRFVGRDLTPLLHGERDFPRANEPLYFMTDDDVTRGLHQVGLTGKPYNSVIQPNHIEAVFTTLKTGENETEEIWKLSRYFDNPQFWSNPGVEDVEVQKEGSIPVSDDVVASICLTTTKTQPVPDQFELYNLTKDPLEEKNLAIPVNATVESKIVQNILVEVLKEQCQQKRLAPRSGDVPGMPSCNF